MMKLLRLPLLIPDRRNLVTLFCCVLFLWPVPQADADTTVGGTISTGTLYACQVSPTLRNVTIASSKTCGAYLYTSESTIEKCTFSGNQNYDLYDNGTKGGSVSGSTINQKNAFPIKACIDNIGEISASTFNNMDAASYLQISGGTVSRDATWTAAIPQSPKRPKGINLKLHNDMYLCVKLRC